MRTSQNTNGHLILIVEDEPSVRQLLFDMLSSEYRCVTAGSAEEGLTAFKTGKFDLVISDINLGGMSGVEMIPHLHQASPDTVVMMISGNQTIDSAIEAMRVGAFDYLKKPFDLNHVFAAVRRALSHQSLLVSKRRYEEELEKLVEERTAQLNYLTYHDALTNLPNRTLLEDRLGQLIVTSRQDTINAVMLVAIDRLRMIQETLGAEISNQVINGVSDRIIETVGADITVGRIDGGIFAILLPDTGPENASRIASHLIERLDSPFSFGEHDIFLHSKIGISLHPNDGEDVHMLMRNAGAALSYARESNNGAIRFYTSVIDERASQRLALENDLRRAIERNEFDVYYQPKIDTATGAIRGMEALIRWQHPTRGNIPPADFIPLAEETGMIGPITEWVLRKACLASKALIHSFSLDLAVNLSGIQLQEIGISARIGQILDETGFNPGNLNIEVTETSIMRNMAVSIGELSDMQKLGVHISIDDFGTGYSSLNSLKQLPIDVLKIDRCFINDVANDADDAAFVMTIINLAHNLRMKVVAEGVETEEQLKLLRLLRCDEWQGFLFSKPVPFADFDRLLRSSKLASRTKSFA